MSQEQLIQARELLRQKRYDEARALLRGIDHPTARQWLEKLERIAPETASPAPASPPPPEAEPAPAPTIKDQLIAARALIAASRFDEARTRLAQIDHPTAQQWLTKLDQIAPALTPSPEPAASPVVAVPPHDEIVREAQQLLLKGDYDRAREMLAALDTPVAAFWLDKTAVNQLRSHENLWLDMFRYAPPDDADPAAWVCPACGRKTDQITRCPQRGQATCPAQVSERPIEEPRRLALVLEALQHDQTRNIEKLIGALDVGRLERWRSALQWQRDHLLEPDIRRPAIEATITLLGQLIEK